MDSTYRVLVTGFVPFGGHATNISQAVASAMEGRRLTTCPWSKEERSVMVEVDILRLTKRERSEPLTVSCRGTLGCDSSCWSVRFMRSPTH